MTATNMFKARRKFKIAGVHVTPGDLINLADFDLPPGRAQQLVDMRLGEYQTGGAATVSAPGSDPTNSPAIPELGTGPVPVRRVLSEGLLKAMKRSQLVDECESRGLSSDGYRTDLIDRLLAEQA